MTKKKLTEQQIFEMFPSVARLKADLESQGVKIIVSGTLVQQSKQSRRQTKSKRS